MASERLGETFSPAFEYIAQLVQRRSAIVLEPEKNYLIEARLSPVARANGFESVEELAASLAQSSFNSLHRRVVEAMTTNETSFFRDLYPFEALRRSVVPELLVTRAPERRIDIWCAACSSGQEPYSVAMLLKEHFPTLAGWKVSIIATDLSTAMLGRARAGRYSQLEVNRGLPAPLLVKYFTKVETDWVIRDDIRHAVEYREMNLAESWPLLPAMDVVFLRNALIYFDVATKKDILQRMRRTLRPNGMLFLGGAETTLGLSDDFERMAVDKASAYRLTNASGRMHVRV